MFFKYTCVVNDIKTYQEVNQHDPYASFRISKMEDIYETFKGQGDAPHRHDYYTIILVRDAKGKHFIDFEEYALQPARVHFVSPGQVHQIIEEKQSSGFSFVFSDEFLIQNNIPRSFIQDLNLFHDCAIAPPLDLTPEQLAELLSITQEISSYHFSQKKFKEQAIGALIKLFLIACNNACQIPFENHQKLEAGNALLRNFKGLVENNFATWHQATQYAEALHISSDHLNRTVKALIGKNAKEYIQNRIIVAAKRKLYFSDLSNKEIGYELGFSEPANFSAFFKKYTGESPSSFRKHR